jgi:hypothetical protein
MYLPAVYHLIPGKHGGDSMSDLTTLSQESGFPEDYLLLLKGIQDGTESDYSDEDALQVEELDEQLRDLEIED